MDIIYTLKRKPIYLETKEMMKENKLKEGKTETYSTELSDETVRKLQLIDKIIEKREKGENIDELLQEFELINLEKYQ